MVTNRDGLVAVSEVLEAARPVGDKTASPQTPQVVVRSPLGDLPLIKAARRTWCQI